MDLGLSGRRALVTASSGGIGRAIAEALAREGAEVVINGRSEASVSEAIDAIREANPGAALRALAADLATADGVAAAIDAYPDVDVLVNNLGVYEAVDFFDIDDGAWARLFETNVMSGVRLSRHHLRRMLDRDSGRIVFISSESAIHPAQEMAHYSMTKTAQLSVARSLAELTKGTSVTVNAVLPGPTRTDTVIDFMSDVMPEEDPDAVGRRFVRENRPTSLIQRLIDPVEVGAFVAFIAGAKASAINGAALRVDGGVVRSVV